MSSFHLVPLHFRFNTRTKHISLIGGKSKDKYAYMTMTHSSKSGHKKNIKLEKNPNINDSRDAYLVKSIFIDDRNKFSSKIKNLSLTRNDNKKIRLWFDNNKYFQK